MVPLAEGGGIPSTAAPGSIGFERTVTVGSAECWLPWVRSLDGSEGMASRRGAAWRRLTARYDCLFSFSVSPLFPLANVVLTRIGLSKAETEDGDTKVGSAQSRYGRTGTGTKRGQVCTEPMRGASEKM